MVLYINQLMFLKEMVKVSLSWIICWLISICHFPKHSVMPCSSLGSGYEQSQSFT